MNPTARAAARWLPLLTLASCALVPEPASRRGPLPADDSIARGCTSIMVGRLASTDGSVITSHTCDGNYRTWLQVQKAKKHKKAAQAKVYKGRMHTEFPADTRGIEELGTVEQVERSYAFLDTAYPCMNEHQLAMGESTFGGRREMRSKEGIFYVEELQRLALERTRTARDAIRLMGELAETHGYIDGGEMLTVADPKEVWHFEIVGPGKGQKGAVWAAVRIPDNHIGVAANLSRISEVHLDQPDRYMGSEHVATRAEELGLWDSEKGEPFRFWKAYGGSRSFTSREFWVFQQLAPSLELDFKAEELPLTVKPEAQVSVREVFRLFRDPYEGSEQFELTRNLVVEDRRTKKKIPSGYVNPWMSRGRQALYNSLKPGVIESHRPIPVMYNAYHTVIQCRGWLPDPIGGICWLGFDNPGVTPRAPIFCGVNALPADLAVCNQHRFRRDSAAWAFRRVARLACINWGANKKKIRTLLREIEDKGLMELPMVERRALELHSVDPAEAREYLTDYTATFLHSMTHRYWELGDELWMSYRFNL